MEDYNRKHLNCNAVSAKFKGYIRDDIDMPKPKINKNPVIPPKGTLKLELVLWAVLVTLFTLLINLGDSLLVENAKFMPPTEKHEFENPGSTPESLELSRKALKNKWRGY